MKNINGAFLWMMVCIIFICLIAIAKAIIAAIEIFKVLI
jgi:hypothetical protein